MKKWKIMTFIFKISSCTDTRAETHKYILKFIHCFFSILFFKNAKTKIIPEWKEMRMIKIQKKMVLEGTFFTKTINALNKR